MIKLKRAKLTTNNGSVVVYYSRNGIMRFPTGVTIGKKKSKDGKYLEWDYKDNFIKTTVTDYEIKNAQIKALLDRTNDILTEYHSQGDELTSAELQKLLSDEQHQKVQTRVAGVFGEYDLFYQRKREYFAARDKIVSLKDYTSFRNMLIDYEHIHEQKLQIRDVDRNKQFLHKLLNWLKGPMPKKVGDHVIKIRGKMGDKACKKRFDILLQFWKDLKDEGKVSDTDFIQKFMAAEIQPLPGDKVTLTVKEIHTLYDYAFDQTNLSNIRDLFVFVCLTGLRWSDLKTFDPRFISPADGETGFVYKKKAKKTRSSSGKGFTIPLCDMVLAILEKHGGTLKPLMISNVEANRRIKEALQVTGMYNEITEIVDKETGEYLKRYEAVTMHKGRDTFISNLVDVAPLNELLKYTALTKLSTLQGYVDRNRPVSMKYVTSTFNRNNIS